MGVPTAIHADRSFVLANPVTLLWNVVATLGIGFERHGPTPEH